MLNLLKKKWKEYIIELFLVMLGIIIPFLIYKFNDKCQIKKQEKHYQEMLRLDLREDLSLLQYNYDSIIADQKIIVSFLNEINRETTIKETNLKNVIPKIVKYYHFIPFNSTFKELESTGNIGLISNLKARKCFFEYYRLAELIYKMENAYELETEQYLKPSILKYFPIRRLSQYDFEYSSNSKFPINLKAISEDVNFENSLLIKIDLLNNMREVYRSLIELNKETEKVLQN